jgi:hypothetical protein
MRVRERAWMGLMLLTLLAGSVLGLDQREKTSVE